MNNASAVEPLHRGPAAEAELGGALSLPRERRNDVERLREEIVAKLAYSIGKDPIVAKDHDWLFAAILVARDRIIDSWMASTREAYRVGRKRVFIVGLLAFAGSSLLCALAPSVPLLVGARILQAAGGAMMIPTTLGLILAAFPAEQRPLAVAIWSAVGGAIARAQARGEVRPGNPRLMALSLIGPMMLGAMWIEVMVPAGGEPMDLDALAAEHFATVADGLLINNKARAA